jgi:hypothetical protein
LTQTAMTFFGILLPRTRHRLHCEGVLEYRHDIGRFWFRGSLVIRHLLFLFSFARDTLWERLISFFFFISIWRRTFYFHQAVLLRVEHCIALDGLLFQLIGIISDSHSSVLSLRLLSFWVGLGQIKVCATIPQGFLHFSLDGNAC